MTLREAGVDLIDCDHRTPPAVETGFPYVAIPQIANGRIDFTTARKISREHLIEWTRKAKPSPYDVVLSRRCNPGETAPVTRASEFALGQNLVLLRSNGSKVRPDFLRWLVSGPEWWEQIQKFLNVGAVFDSLRCADVPKFELTIPPIAAQERIAGILSALNDKIELNRQMSQTLEAMARALFSDWFSVIGAGRVPASELIESKVLEIGDGYRAKNSEMAEVGIPFVRAGDLQTGLDLEGAEKLSAESAAKTGNKLSRAGDVAFTSKGTIGRFARVGRDLQPFVYSPQVCYWRSLDSARLHSAVLYAWMLTGDFLDQLMAIAGQTDMAPYASLQDQRRLSLPVLPESQRKIGEALETVFSRVAAARQESRTLSGIRDSLLPKLLGGELGAPQRAD